MNCIQVKYPLNLYSQCSFVLCDIVENAQVAEGAFKGLLLTKQCKICILCNKHKCLLFDFVWLVWNEKVAFNVRKCILFHCSPVLFQNTEQPIILFIKFISVFYFKFLLIKMLIYSSLFWKFSLDRLFGASCFPGQCLGSSVHPPSLLFYSMLHGSH